MAVPSDLVGRHFVIPIDKRGRMVLPPELRQYIGAPCRVTFDRVDDGTARIRVVAPESEAVTSVQAGGDDRAEANKPHCA